MTLRAVNTKPRTPLEIARVRVLEYRRKKTKGGWTQRMIDGSGQHHEKEFIARAVKFSRRSWIARILGVFR